MTLLTTKQGRPLLTVSEVVDRAKGEFGFVHIDPANGVRFVAKRLLEMNPRPAHDAAEQLIAPFAESVEMIVGDDRHSDTEFLKCYVIPNEPIQIQYMYDGHAAQVSQLLSRLEAILNYETVSN